MTKKWLLSLLVICLILAVPIASATAISKTLTYDSNGNLIQDVDVYYGYNSLNQLVSVRENSATGRILEQYAYDEGGNRIKKVTFRGDGSQETVYYIDANFVRVVNSSGTFDFKYYYLYGQLVAQETQGEKRYYLTDNIGSISVVTDQNGGILQETEYQPFGSVTSGGDSRYTFTGKEKDSTGIMYFGARYYSPFLKQFTQADTIIQDVYDPQALNRYAYARNNPLKYTDPSGHFINIVIGMVIGAGLDAIWQIANGKSIFDRTINWGNIGKSALLGGVYMAGLAVLTPITTGGIAGVASGVITTATSNVMSGNSITAEVSNPMMLGASIAGGMINEFGSIKSNSNANGWYSNNKISSNPLYTRGDIPQKGYTYLNERAGLIAGETGKIQYKGSPIYGTFDKYSNANIVKDKLLLQEEKIFRAEFPMSQFNKNNLEIPKVNEYLDPYTTGSINSKTGSLISGSGGGSQLIIEENIANVVVRRLK